MFFVLISVCGSFELIPVMGLNMQKRQDNGVRVSRRGYPLHKCPLPVFPRNCYLVFLVRCIVLSNFNLFGGLCFVGRWSTLGMSCRKWRLSLSSTKPSPCRAASCTSRLERFGKCTSCTTSLSDSSRIFLPRCVIVSPSTELH